MSNTCIYLLHGCSRPESPWVANSVDNSGCEDGGHRVAGKAVQPRQEHCNVEHPAAIVLPVMDRVDDLPEPVQRVDDHAGRCCVEQRSGNGWAVDQEAKSHPGRTGVAVVFEGT